jgi:hypothetical protein
MQRHAFSMEAAPMRTFVAEIAGQPAVDFRVRPIAMDLGTIKSRLDHVETRLDHMVADIVVIKADLSRHGRMLDVLTQDVRMIRTVLEGNTK